MMGPSPVRSFMPPTVLSILVWESPGLWPAAVALGAAMTVAVLWLYPSQVRRLPLGGWAAVGLRWVAVMVLAISLLKPVILRPKTAEQWGAVVVLLDCSRSMSVTDPGRTPAEQVALAGAMGRLPPGTRSGAGADLAGELDALGARAQEVAAAQADVEYARVSGRGIAERQADLNRSADRYGQASRALAGRAGSFPEGSTVRQALADLAAAPAPADPRDAWDRAAERVAKARELARQFQSAADEALYRADAAVRAQCEALAKLSRLALAEQAVLYPEAGLVARLGGKMPVLGFTIDDRGLRPVDLTAGGQPITTPLNLRATGNRSDLTGAVAVTLAGMSRRPLRAVVLLSDGRQVGGRGDITSALRPGGVPIFTIGMAPARVPDISIGRMALPALSAFAGETLEGQVEVTLDGSLRPPADVRIVGAAGERAAPLVAAPSSAARMPRGRRFDQTLTGRFAVPVAPSGGLPIDRLIFSVPPVPGETTEANNRVERWIKVSAEKLRVAVCTAAPTWDFQYLRAALARRPWIALESRVMDATHPKLGLAPAEIVAQDVLVLDDVPVDALDVNQWDAVNTLVQARGGTVILIAGRTYPVADYVNQPQAGRLLPFQYARPAWNEWQGEQPPFHFMPTIQGEQAALRLGDGTDAESRRVWQELPGVYRYLQIPDRDLKPGVQRLLVESGGGTPVLTESRAGAGRVLFLGLDETWRWRLKGGEQAADRFWRQLVRHAAGEPYAASSGPLALDVDKVAVEPGEPVHVRARVRGAKFPPEDARACTLELMRGGTLAWARAMPAAGGGGRFALDVHDLTAGDYQLVLRGAAADGKAVAVRVPLHVAYNDEAEMRDISGDRDMLRRIARSSGGAYLPIDQVDRLPERLNALRETEPQFVRRPLWNSPYLFLFVLACFAGEWAMRKRLGLA